MVSYTTDSGVKKPLSTPTIRIARSMFTNLGSKDTTNYASLQRTRRTPPNIPITTTGLLAPKAGQGRSRTTGTLGSVPDVTTFSKSQLESFGQIGAGLSDTNIKVIHHNEILASVIFKLKGDQMISFFDYYKFYFFNYNILDYNYEKSCYCRRWDKWFGFSKLFN